MLSRHHPATWRHATLSDDLITPGERAPIDATGPARGAPTADVALSCAFDGTLVAMERQGTLRGLAGRVAGPAERARTPIRVLTSVAITTWH